MFVLAWFVVQMAVHWLTGALGLGRVGSLTVWAGVNVAAATYLASQAAVITMGLILMLTVLGAISYFLGSLSLEKRAKDQQLKREFDAAEAESHEHSKERQ